MTNKDLDKVSCRSPDPSKTPTNIPKWKYDTVANAIMEILRAEEAAYFSDLPDKVGETLSPEARDNLGSLAWHVTTVKLEMETRGDIERVEGKGKHRLRLTR